MRFHGPDALCAIAHNEKRPYNIYYMEQHPVPQNVTTFQFRLIGDMTIKQFGYLAGGAILAYISYKLPLPFFFTWPAATLFALGGVGFAFVPVEERPMDVWVLSFIKNIYSPTQFVWSKDHPQMPQQKTVTPPQATSDVLKRVFTPPIQPSVPPTITHVAPFPKPYGPVKVLSSSVQTNPWNWFSKLFAPPPIPQRAPEIVTPNVAGHHFDFTPPPIVKDVIKKTEEKEIELEHKMSSLKEELAHSSMAESRVLELQKQLTEVLAEKEKMEEELAKMRQQPPPVSIVTPTTPQATHVASPGTTVKIITADRAVKAGLPRLTTFPNVVTGIAKDSDNNFLPGVLVTVKDRDGMPLRALKTNRLGQFAASTPLANGIYFVEIEDPRSRFTFDRVQITLNGSIVPALEIIAKSPKAINRAMLAKELFGTPS